jgi:TonB family protein
MALLAAHGSEPGVAEKLKAGLSSAEPNTRGAAARAINVAAQKELLAGVQAALAAESEPLVAREQIRTLASGGAAYNDSILEARRRFAPKLDHDIVQILAQAEGPDAIPLYFRALAQLSLSHQELRDFIRVATRGRPDLLVASASMALGRHDAALWQAVLEVSGSQGSQMEPSVLLAALSSGSEAIRGEASWYLARMYHAQRPSNAASIMETVASDTSASANAPEWRFGAELLARVLGRSPTEDDGWLIWLQKASMLRLQADFGDGGLLEHLTRAEREVVDLRKFKPTSPRQQDLVRLVNGVPTGVVEDLFDLEGCHSLPTMRWFAVAVVDFRADGIPRSVRVTAKPPGGSCDRTSRTLFEMSLAPYSDADPTRSASYLVLFDPDELRCADALTEPAGRVEGAVRPPTLVKKVDPIYPKEARRNKEEGVSIYEAIISNTGCIRDLRLLKSSTPILDIMGMEAVSRWVYSPATLDGRPVAVYLTVSVTFSLHSGK